MINYRAIKVSISQLTNLVSFSVSIAMLSEVLCGKRIITFLIVLGLHLTDSTQCNAFEYQACLTFAVSINFIVMVARLLEEPDLKSTTGFVDSFES
jgi:hypothetical protein